MGYYLRRRRLEDAVVRQRPQIVARLRDLRAVLLVRLGNGKGDPRVFRSKTVPVPADTVPLTGTGLHYPWSATGMAGSSINSKNMFNNVILPISQSFINRFSSSQRQTRSADG